MIDDAKFISIINAALIAFRMTEQDLGDALSVGGPMIAQWRKGENLPGQAFRESVAGWILTAKRPRLRIKDE
jgi:hypothetical protein